MRMTQKKARSRTMLKLTLAALFVLLCAVGATFKMTASPLPPSTPPQLLSDWFLRVIDQDGANDENGQGDLTQMGRDDDDYWLHLFWSWDWASWTGNNKGDACALFDTNGDGFVNYAVCGEVQEGSGGAVVQSAGSPYVFQCSNGKTDRCSNPQTIAHGPEVQAGVFGTLAAGDLRTATDPFANGDDAPLDTTLQLAILKSFFPPKTTLVNVCSYNSLGSGDNTSPNDCIAPAGDGFLVINKQAPDNTTQTFTFDVSRTNDDPGPTQYQITGSGTTGAFAVKIGKAVQGHSITEEAVNGWNLIGASCQLESGASTGSANFSSQAISNITIQSGKVTTCTFKNSQDNPTPADISVIKNNDANRDGIFSDTESVPVNAGYPYTVTYSLTIHNSGGPGTISSITDDKTTIFPLSASTTAPDDALSCLDVLNSGIGYGDNITCYYDVAFSNADAGQVVNTATVNGSASDTSTVNFAQNTSLSLTKAATQTSYNAVGDVLNYTYTVTNAGNVSIAGPVTISDDKTSVTCPSAATLAPLASVTCSSTYNVTQADLDAGSVINHATASASSATSDVATVTVYAVKNPGMSLKKTAGQSSYNTVGDILTYTYTITNTGNVTLNGPFAVSDDKTSVTCPSTVTLAPLASITCNSSYTVTQADLDAGSVTNHATASASQASSNQDTVTVNASQTRSMSLTKTAGQSSYDTVGSTLTYSYVIKNTGNVALNGPFTVSDDKTSVTCPPTATLAPQAAITCTSSYTVTQADLNAGSVTNNATATASTTTSNQATATVPAVKKPLLGLVKSAAESTYTAAGNALHYSYTATNTGNLSLAGPVTVADDKASVSCPAVSTVGNNDSMLDPGETVICSATYTVTQSDLDSGSVTNKATATAGGTNSSQATKTIDATQTPGLTLTKTVTSPVPPGKYDHVGQILTYNYALLNSGNVTLSAPYTVTDDKTSVSCPGIPATLAPGATVNCTSSYTVTQADLNAGSVTNNATAKAGATTSAPTSATVKADPKPALGLVKSATESTYTAAGNTLHYSYAVTNTGNVSLAGPVTVADDKTSVSCPAVSTVGNNDNMLDSGEAVICSATHTVTQSDLDSGSVTNKATATAGSTNSSQVTLTINATQTPALSLIKSVTSPVPPGKYDHVGQILTYNYALLNSGNVTLSAPYTVTDNKTSVSCPATPATLAPGATVNCTSSYTVTLADLNAGSVTNTATGSAMWKSSPIGSKSSSATVNADQKPAISLSKTVTSPVPPGKYDHVGQILTYNYALLNSGNVTLSAPYTVTDNKTSVSCPATPATLAPGATVNCTSSYTIMQANLDGGSVTNTATGHAMWKSNNIASNSSSATVLADQKPAISLSKTASPTVYSAAGQIITYTFTITNAGNVTLSGSALTDSLVGYTNATCGVPTLAPGATSLCLATYTIKSTDLNSTYNKTVLNTATASATGALVTVTSTATATVSQVKPTSQIAETGSTCQQFASGTALGLAAVNYSIKGTKIGSISPGVFFYYNKVTVGAGQAITVSQTNFPSPAWPLIATNKDQVILYDSACNKVAGVKVSSDATGMVSITGVAAGTYYFSVKYDPTVLVGYAPTGTPTHVYMFQTSVGGVPQPASGATVNVVKK